MKLKKITVLIPCYNEEKGIGKVIDSIPVSRLHRLGYNTDIIVIDNNCTDKTSSIAQSKGARVISEEKPGKGHAIRTGMNAVKPDTDYVVMMDGDNTYKGKEIPRLVEPLASNFCDVVVGSRLGGKIKSGSLRFTNRVANWAFTFFVRQIYRANVTDVLSGFFAWKHKALRDLLPHLESRGFAIEMEMITKMVKLKQEIYSVPITYEQREGESKIEAISDGLKIFNTLIQNLSWSPEKRSAQTKLNVKESY